MFVFVHIQSLLPDPLALMNEMVVNSAKSGCIELAQSHRRTIPAIVWWPRWQSSCLFTAACPAQFSPFVAIALGTAQLSLNAQHLLIYSPRAFHLTCTAILLDLSKINCVSSFKTHFSCSVIWPILLYFHWRLYRSDSSSSLIAFVRFSLFLLSAFNSIIISSIKAVQIEWSNLAAIVGRLAL